MSAYAHSAHAASGPDLLLLLHWAAAALWVGSAGWVALRPSRARVRAAARPAVAGAVIGCTSGLVTAARSGVDLGSPYGRVLLAKGVLVLAVLGVGALLLRRPGLVRVEALGLAAVVVLALGLSGSSRLDLPDGLAVTPTAGVLVALDGDGRRLVRVTPATARVEGVRLSAALDGAAIGVLPEGTDRLRVDGRHLELPRAVPLATGPGDDAERLARTVGRLLGGRVGSGGDVTASVRTDLDAALARGLRRPVVLVDDDPRGAALAEELRLPAVRGNALQAADLVYVATSWGGAPTALSAVRDAAPSGGAVLLPWLVGATTADAARAGGITLLSDRALDGSDALAYRNALRVLPGERPSLTGLSSWTSVRRPAAYAAAPAGVLPALLDHDHDGPSSLPPWVIAGGLTAIRDLTPGGSR